MTSVYITIRGTLSLISYHLFYMAIFSLYISFLFSIVGFLCHLDFSKLQGENRDEHNKLERAYNILFVYIPLLGLLYAMGCIGLVFLLDVYFPNEEFGQSFILHIFFLILFFVGSSIYALILKIKLKQDVYLFPIACGSLLIFIGLAIVLHNIKYETDGNNKNED